MNTIGRSLVHVARSRLAEALGGTPPGPMMAYVELTRRCNLRCRQCEVWKTAARDPAQIARELDAATWLRVLGEMRRMGLVAVDLFGGEPLLRPDLAAIVRGARALALHVTVTTNGWGLDAARAASLVDAGLSQLLVSVDGARADSHDALRGRAGSFSRAVAGLRHARAAGPHLDLGLNVVVSRANLRELPALVALARDLSLDSFRLLPYHACYPFDLFDGTAPELAPGPEDIAWLEQALPRLRRELRAAGIATNARAFVEGIPDWFRGRRRVAPCAAGFLVCDIIASGDLMTCFGHAQVVGNVAEAPFAALWRGERLGAHRRLLRREDCRDCWQSCYVEPALRSRLGPALRDPAGLLEELRRYFTRRGPA